jgi:hypothetical protein
LSAGSRKQVFVPLAVLGKEKRGNWGEVVARPSRIVPLASISNRYILIE